MTVQISKRTKEQGKGLSQPRVRRFQFMCVKTGLHDKKTAGKPRGWADGGRKARRLSVDSGGDLIFPHFVGIRAFCMLSPMLVAGLPPSPAQCTSYL